MKLTDPKTFIRAMADNNLKCSVVGKKMYLSPATVSKYCDIIKEDTGLDPRRFRDMVSLLRIIDNEDVKRPKYRSLRKLIDELLGLSDVELADRALHTSDVRWCLMELKDYVEAMENGLLMVVEGGKHRGKT